MPLGGVIFLAFFVLIFGAACLWLANKLGIKRSEDTVRQSLYECGIPGEETKETRISVNFYLTAILFIIFDIEIIFLYPWALVYKDFILQGNGMYVFVPMAIFLLIFIFGLFWEIKSKALEWE